MNIKNKQPPKVAKAILTKLLPPYLKESALGDYDELYNQIRNERGSWKGWFWYWLQVLKFLPSSLFWGFVMFINHIKVTCRNIQRNKSHSFIIIAGLTIALSLGFLIIQIINTAYSYDQFHVNKDNIYRIVTRYSTDQKEVDLASAPMPLAPLLIEECPGVSKVVRIKAGFGGEALYNTQRFNLDTLIVDAEFFQIFSFQLEEGDPLTALSEPRSLVLTHEIASGFFSSAKSPIGEIIHLEGVGDFTISGVLKQNVDINSHIDLKSLISVSTLPFLVNQNILEPCQENWHKIRDHYIYFLMENKASLNPLKPFLKKYANRYLDTDYTVDFRVQPLTDILPGNSLANHLGSTHPILSIYILSGLAIIIALIAAFNYTNLTIARSITRTMEVGIRKVMGASRRQLFLQFTGEAITISIIALILAFILYHSWLVPSLRDLHPIFAKYFLFKNNLGLMACFIGFAIFTGLFASFLPSLYISRFRPITVLSGLKNIKIFSRIRLRKILIVFQFTLSLVFIISSIIAYNQLNHIKTLDPGFKGENIINVQLKGMDYWLYKQEISQNSNVLGVSACSHLPGVSTNRRISLYQEKSAAPLAFIYLSVDHHFLENLKIPLKAGNNFRKFMTQGNNRFILINQLAAQKLGFERPRDALGHGLTTKKGEILEIIAVTEDFSQNSLQDSVKPAVMQMIPANFHYLNIGVNARNRGRTIEFLQKKWELMFPGIPFHYAPYNVQMEAEYEAAQLLPGIIRFLAVIAILISCLGLLGITDYSAKIRTKEIGIRKVFGANVQSLIGILSKEFTYMLSISILLAIPTSYYLNKVLLKLYERQVPMKIEFFILGGLLMLILGLFTVFSQTVKVAQANPVDTLKYE